MDLIMAVVGGVVVLILLLAARGAYLIGQGTDAEFEARSKSSGSSVLSTGWAALDTARTYGKDEQQAYRCPDCRHAWTDENGTGWPACPNCGNEETIQAD